MSYKLNNKGFTLVELLAVIVVLAIIMIIAIPSVMDSMNNAREGAFKIQAQKVLNKAQEKFQSDMLLGTLPTGTTGTSHKYTVDSTGFAYCYPLSELGFNASNYIGYVVLYVDKSSTSAISESYITITDKANNTLNQKSYTQLNGTEKVIDVYDSSVIYNCPGSWTITPE